MVISTFSGRLQPTALSISFQFMRMARAKLSKMSLGDVLEGVIEWGSIKGLSQRHVLKYSQFEVCSQNLLKNMPTIFFFSVKMN